MTAPRAVPASDKLHYRLSEVCELTDTQPYVLRFWEQEFPQLAPEKSRSGQRLYRREDLDLVRQIKHLLYDREFTITAARAAIERGETIEFPEAAPDDSERDTGAGSAPRSRGAGGKDRTPVALAPGAPAPQREISEDLAGLLFDSAAPANSAPGGGTAPRRPARRDAAGEDDLAALEARLKSAEARAEELARACSALEAEKADLAGSLESARAIREREIRTQAETRGRKDNSAVEALKDELARLRTEGERKIAELSGEAARAKIDADARARETARLRKALDHARAEVRNSIAELRSRFSDDVRDPSGKHAEP